MSARDLGAIWARLGPHLRQQAYVVEDLGLAKQSMAQSFGCTRWFEFESTTPWELRGKTIQCDLGLAFSRSGNMMVELMEPRRGQGLHFELLRDRGAGPHHLGFFVDDYDEFVVAATADGFPPIMSGEMGNSRFCYLDTLDEIGLYLELIHDPDRAMTLMMPWWDELGRGAETDR